MVHILFGLSSSSCLKYILKKLKKTNSEKIITFSDIFSVGPIYNINNSDGISLRQNWMQNILDEDFSDYKDYFKKTLEEINLISKDETVCIWCSENADEQTGLRYVINLLSEKTNNLKIVNASKICAEIIKSNKFKIKINHTCEVSPDKLLEIYEKLDDINFITKEQKDILISDWAELSNEKETLRIWENNKIINVSEDYFDNVFISCAKKLHKKNETKDQIKAARLVGEVLGCINQHVGDEFLQYRLKKLIEKNVFASEGSLKAMRYYSIKLLKS